MNKDHTGLTPGNKEGREINAEACTEFSNNEEAKSFFDAARQRLLAVNHWGNIAGKLSADFQLTDVEGKEVNRTVQKNDYFKIDIKGPKSTAGNGHDWVRVEDIKEVHTNDVDSIAILVRPDSNPQTSNDNVAHFYSEKSTSTFIVTREKSTVTAAIYDRNIEANEETGEPSDKLRNAAVGLAAKYGFSKLQWKALAEALVKKG
jgi:hypothetical protein